MIHPFHSISAGHLLLTLSLLGSGPPAANTSSAAPSSLVPPPAAVGEGVPGEEEAHGLPWDRRSVEHVWNRAGFGIRAEEVDAWVEAGPRALVDHLMRPRPSAGEGAWVPYRYEPLPYTAAEYNRAEGDEKRELRKRRNRWFKDQFAAFREGWVEGMVAGEDPLRDRMTLMWHGVFTSSLETVKRPSLIIEQHKTIRSRALGSYSELLHAMLEDPALLVYLDNDDNRKGRPNENLAREVMELFSLGEGNYGEADISEAARSLTGAGVAPALDVATYRFNPRRHDDDAKTILGVSGNHGPADLAEILLSQPACASYIARTVIEYLEGVPAADDRVEEYAARLRETGYDVGYLVERLLLDPRFYRDEVIGARVASPIDFLVGSAIRLETKLPAGFIVEAAADLGQDLFQPPNVKGWDEGLAWITTSTFMMRGNIAGAIVGAVDVETLRADATDMMEMSGAMDEMGPMTGKQKRRAEGQQIKRYEVAGLASTLRKAKYEPSSMEARAVRDAGASTDREVVEILAERLLAIEPPQETLQMLEGQLREIREKYEIEAADMPRFRRKNQRALHEFSHLVLSLPEAQLH